MSIQPQSLPAQKIRQSGFFTAGLALFSMFFGAGNLIFPLLIGKAVGSNVWFAIFGLGVTAVIVPFLGLGAMVLFQADYHRFFGRLGKVPGMLLLLVLQLLLGPFGVIPRLVTLMHATLSSYLFDMPLVVFSILAAFLIFGCSFQRKRLIGFLGAVLTPLLVLSLTALVFFGLTGDSSVSPVTSAAEDSFLQGLVGGYNMMDLISAFLFATVVLPHFQKETELEHPTQRRRSLMKKMVFSSLIAGALLFLTYVGLCLISARHGASIDPAQPQEQMLSTIAVRLLGPAGGCIAKMAVVLACLTTMMTLVAIFADYLQKDLCKKKISSPLAVVVTLAITTLFANLGFGGIAAFLGPIVQIVYPGLILLTLLNIFHSLYGYRLVKWPVFLTFGATAVHYFV